MSAPSNPLSALEMTRLALFKMYNQAGLPPAVGGPHGPPLGPSSISQASLEMGRAMVEQQARALQAAQREAEAREKAVELSAGAGTNSKSPSGSSEQRVSASHKDLVEKQSGRSKESSEKSRGDIDDEDMSPPPMKRERQDSFDQRNGSPIGMGAHIRIANRGKVTSLFTMCS